MIEGTCWLVVYYIKGIMVVWVELICEFQYLIGGKSGNGGQWVDFTIKASIGLLELDIVGYIWLAEIGYGGNCLDRWVDVGQ